MVAYIEKGEAEVLLQPILEQVRACIDAAWTEWDSFYATRHHILDARARASIVYCHMVHEARSLLGEIPGVVCKRIRGIFWVFVGDQITLRFKKADSNGLTRNIPTRQQRLIDLHLTLPDILPTTYVNAVYQLDDVQQSIEKMMITLQLGNQIKWSIDLKESAESMATLIPSMLPTPPSNTRGRAKVKEEFQRNKKKQENQNS